MRPADESPQNVLLIAAIGLRAAQAIQLNGDEWGRGLCPLLADLCAVSYGPPTVCVAGWKRIGSRVGPGTWKA